MPHNEDCCLSFIFSLSSSPYNTVHCSNSGAMQAFSMSPKIPGFMSKETWHYNKFDLWVTSYSLQANCSLTQNSTYHYKPH